MSSANDISGDGPSQPESGAKNASAATEALTRHQRHEFRQIAQHQDVAEVAPGRRRATAPTPKGEGRRRVLLGGVDQTSGSCAHCGDPSVRRLSP